MVDEMQWTGDNEAEMRAWAGRGNFLGQRHGWPAFVISSGADGVNLRLDVHVGDWVARHDPVPRWADLGGDFPVRRGPVFTVRRPA